MLLRVTEKSRKNDQAFPVSQTVQMIIRLWEHLRASGFIRHKQPRFFRTYVFRFHALAPEVGAISFALLSSPLAFTASIYCSGLVLQLFKRANRSLRILSIIEKSRFSSRAMAAYRSMTVSASSGAAPFANNAPHSGLTDPSPLYRPRSVFPVPIRRRLSARDQPSRFETLSQAGLLTQESRLRILQLS